MNGDIAEDCLGSRDIIGRGVGGADRPVMDGLAGSAGSSKHGRPGRRAWRARDVVDAQVGACSRQGLVDEAAAEQCGLLLVGARGLIGRGHAVGPARRCGEVRAGASVAGMEWSCMVLDDQGLVCPENRCWSLGL